MNKGNKYPDGYRPKIEYWIKRYQEAVHRFDELKSLEKLNYFVNKEYTIKLASDLELYEDSVSKTIQGHGKTKEEADRIVKELKSKK